MRHAIDSFVIVAGAVYVLFLPGFVVSYAFFRRGATDIIERLALSFALSIAVVPLVAFYLNLVGVKLNRLNIILEVLAICLIAGIVAWRLDNRPLKHPNNKDTHEKRPPNH